MRQQGSNLTKDDEANQAKWEATRGAVSGAAKYGAFAAVAGGLAYGFSPLYRGLTVQFKVYIQMSCMILGGMLEADRRTIAYQHRMRHQKRMARDMEVWRRFEEDFESKGTPGVGGEGNVKGNQSET
ncbi:hypothetical protein EJ04DRAFT_509448 [Polyplosphaeria fusca]|uniref:Imidazoleglycerol-phosphate dehydratase protein n=1 Tax=Polyplosphaeria fusca TaxID=682080 RepID=A0A9P4R5N0_9PLEO|nr:hypothetical protein EJ04DRAFT_509448 [Polyplosphaeria fusca]